MPIISSTAPAAANPTPPPKGEPIKPLALCLPTTSNIEIPPVSPAAGVTVASLAATAPAIQRNTLNHSTINNNSSSNNSQTNSNSFYPSTTTVSAPSQFPMGQCVMVAKFPANPSIANRQQTVILQPRINTTRTATALQMNPIRGSAVISSQTISSSLTSTTSSSTISVRTRLLTGQNHHHQTSTLPVLNLSTVTNPIASANSASSTSTVKQVIKGPKLLSTTGNLETVNLVMTAPGDAVRNVRATLNNNEATIKTANMLTVQNINSKVNGPKSAVQLPGGSTAIVAQPKIIGINNAGQTNVCQRLGILGTSVGGNKPGIINLTTALPKSFIFTSPNATLTGTGATLANMVSISSAANFAPTGQATKISVTPNHIIADGSIRTAHSVSTTATSLPANINSTLLSPKATIYTVATTGANILNSVSTLPSTASINSSSIVPHAPVSVSYSTGSLSTATVTISTSSLSTASIVNVKPTILATNLSPVKPSHLQHVPAAALHQSTSSSPRPRILSRKRLNSEQTFTIKAAANGTVPIHVAPTSSSSPHTSVLNAIDQKRLPAGCIISTTTSVDGHQTQHLLNSGTVHPIAGTIPPSSSQPPTSAVNAVGSNEVHPILPRKKPRKQLLEPSSSPKKLPELDAVVPPVADYPTTTATTSNSSIPITSTAYRELEVEREVKEKVIVIKRPRPSLRETRSAPYHSQSKSSHPLLPHFMRYSDVKPKPDKKVAITDLLSEVTKPSVGWKISHIAEQLQQSSDDEMKTMQSTLDNFLSVLEKDISPFSKCATTKTLFGDPDADKVDIVDKICVKINDLTRGNLQRTRVILDHYKESKQLLLKLTTDHKDKVAGLAKRIGHKRGYVK